MRNVDEVLFDLLHGTYAGLGRILLQQRSDIVCSAHRFSFQVGIRECGYRRVRPMVKPFGSDG